MIGECKGFHRGFEIISDNKINLDCDQCVNVEKSKRKDLVSVAIKEHNIWVFQRK